MEKKLNKAQIFDADIALSVGTLWGGKAVQRGAALKVAEARDVLPSPRISELLGGDKYWFKARCGGLGCLETAAQVLTLPFWNADSVLNPEAPLALRLSGQLLLGIVRVYLRKLQLLELDARHAVTGLIGVRAALIGRVALLCQLFLPLVASL